MPLTLTTQNARPNHHPNRASNSGYFSYIRRWSHYCEPPPTMTEWEGIWNSLTSRWPVHGIEVSGNDFVMSVRNLYMSREFERIYRQTSSTSNIRPRSVLTLFQMFLNLAISIRHYFDPLGHHCKIDYIGFQEQTHAELMFNRRVVLWLSQTDYRSIRESLATGRWNTIADTAYSIIRQIPSAVRNGAQFRLGNESIPVTDAQIAIASQGRTPAMRTRPVARNQSGGHQGPPVPYRAEADNPRTMLAREYVNRDDRDTENIPPEQVVDMIRLADGVIINQIYELLIQHRIGEEVVEQTTVQIDQAVPSPISDPEPERQPEGPTIEVPTVYASESDLHNSNLLDIMTNARSLYRWTDRDGRNHSLSSSAIYDLFSGITRRDRERSEWISSERVHAFS